ncbi:hypothetical protein N7523_010587 [Penicillium sp. IBT 18751x]|nr:hypothetical protein N7523_010587 [Penicillium sp. IBT 18751x]
MSVIVSVLGSLIGYLGAEVAQESAFERLLWPQRFYNDFTISSFLKLSLLMPMSRPLHAAALATLDKFRDHGLNFGSRQGHMLGTAFYRDMGIKYHLRTDKSQAQVAKDSRNGFWVEVLRNVQAEKTHAVIPVADSESTKNKTPSRALQTVRHLKLNRAEKCEITEANIVIVREDSIRFKAWLGAFCSELSTIVVAIAAAFGSPFKCVWMAVYLCIPLFLKLLSLCASVRRTSLEHLSSHDESSEIFELDDPVHGFSIVQGPVDLVRQFFRHYGHPARGFRESFLADRAREAIAMVLVYSFVLYFPVGLIIVLWMDVNMQYLWVGFQTYTVLVMHIVRIAGWHGCGRTEENIARHLQGGKSVFLQCGGKMGVLATLEMIKVQSVAEGREEVQYVVQNHPHGTSSGKGRKLPRKNGAVLDYQESTGLTGTPRGKNRGNSGRIRITRKACTICLESGIRR